MDLEAFELLRSPRGQEALTAVAATAPTERTLLRCISQLQQRFPSDLTRSAVETVLLRQKAKDKFSRAAFMYFTREALAQASGETIAQHRARRFEGLGVVGDYCCGIGGDTVALASLGPVVAVDLDPLQLAMAGANAEAHAVRHRVEFCQGDLLRMRLPETGAVFFDPDRWADGRRHVSVRHYHPSPQAVLARLPAGLPAGIKVAPAVPREDVDASDAEAEFLSVGGQLKECVLWFAGVRTCGRRATVLPSSATLAAEAPAPSPGVRPPSEFLFDPDPAVVRAQLVTDLGHKLGAHLVDPEIAFLSGPQPADTPFARCYRVLEAMPFHRDKLVAALRAQGVGRVTSLKRGSAVDADAMWRGIRLTGSRHVGVILTRLAGRPSALLVEPIGEAAVRNP